MKKFILQHNGEGGATGVKVICADEVHTTSTGGLVFVIDGAAVAFYSTYAVCSEESFALECEAQTAAWLAAQGE